MPYTLSNNRSSLTSSRGEPAPSLGSVRAGLLLPLRQEAAHNLVQQPWPRRMRGSAAWGGTGARRGEGAGSKHPPRSCGWKSAASTSEGEHCEPTALAVRGRRVAGGGGGGGGGGPPRRHPPPPPANPPGANISPP
eukprot:COSAG04_NODE_11152_length_727_cov_2.773885_1_plen_135_part_10